MLKLFNTLTRKKEEFKPIKKNQVGFYSCGPTVYDYAHLGNLRTYIFADILKRYLKYKGYKVKHVMNITDVGHLTSDSDTGEDKIEKGAKREGKSAWAIAKFYTKAFFEDSGKLNIEKPDIIPTATDHIKEQIDFIKGLERKGFIYVIDDGVYFDTSKLKDYGKLSRLKKEDIKAGARVDMVEGKKNNTDFALWKFTSKGEKRQMEWKSPWGKGFPGWHIECSAMSIKYLGKYFDIHTGAIDHIPIHHTNEIAQAEALLGKPFVKTWLHAEFLLVNAGRMGKSEGNLIKVSDIEDEGFDPLSFRLLTLMAHYRDKLNFTKQSLAAAQNTYIDLLDFISRLATVKISKSEIDIDKEVGKTKKEFYKYLDDDLNAPRALASLFEFRNYLNKLMANDKLGKSEAKKAYILFLEFDKVLGLDIKAKEEKVPEAITKLVEDREKARLEKDFKKADNLRKKILEKGYEVEDTSKGARVRKTR